MKNVILIGGAGCGKEFHNKVIEAFRADRTVIIEPGVGCIVRTKTGCDIIQESSNSPYLIAAQAFLMLKKSLEAFSVCDLPINSPSNTFSPGVTNSRFWPETVSSEIFGKPFEYPENSTYKIQERIEKLKRLSEDQSARKNSILESFYRTGRIDGRYFGRKSKSKRNHVKEYIKGLIMKGGTNEMDLIDDCYNQTFEELYKKNAASVCALYDAEDNRGRKGNGAKLLATALCIVKLKCFAVDPRRGNPHHSLLQSLRFASSTDENNVNIPGLEEHDSDKFANDGAMHGAERLNHSGTETINNYLLTLKTEEPTDFMSDYGFEIEDLIERLTSVERILFYSQISDKKRGRRSVKTIREIELLNRKIKRLREELRRE